MINMKYVERSMMAMGLSASSKGFRYLLEAIDILDDLENSSVRDRCIMSIYEIISKRCTVNVRNVEKCIRYEISKYYEGYTVHPLLAPPIGKVKLPNGEFILRLYHILSDDWNITVA